LGVRRLDTLTLEEIVPYIDWSPFFHAWGLRGRFPQILEQPEVGPRAKELYADAQQMLTRLAKENLLIPKAVYGFFAANAVGDDVEIYEDEARQKVKAVFHFLRQQSEKSSEPYLCLADFVAPKESGVPDYLGMFVVTAGREVEEFIAGFEASHDDYSAILVKALADRVAEALAEYLHLLARRQWYAPDEKLSVEELIRERYRGIRPAPGYPACPDHTEKRTLFDLLDAERAVGVSLTESYAMMPPASVSGLYFSHPEARYFAVGKIGLDQVRDYQRRKGLPLEEIERWLAPYLAYETGR
jgi:5-methyltetrahydrofolate--homocysteine methyltransferase